MGIGNTRYMQYVAAITGTLSIASSVLYVVWSSPILPKIASGNSPLGNITNEQRSWIVSSYALGHIPGSLISGWMLETFGRRGSLVLAGLPILLPWFILAFTSRVWMVCTARFIAGAVTSIAFCAVILYIGEIADKEIRGKLGTSFKVLAITGELIGLCIGPYVSYTTFTLISSIPSLIFVVTFYFMPESPYYLLGIGKEAAARKSLKRLLPNNIKEGEVEEQISVIKRNVDVDKNMSKGATIRKLLSSTEYRKPLGLAFGIVTLHQLSGFQAIASYTQTIILNSQSSVSPEVSSMICGIVQIPAVFVAVALVDRIGRRPLLITSSLGCATALVIEAIYFYLQDIIKADVASLTWMPTSGILLYVIMRSLGIGTLTTILLGEIFAAEVKEYAVAISTLYDNILAFTVAKSFEPVSNAFGMHVMFTLFSVICVLGALFAYFIMPETKGKTFTEIRERMGRKNVTVTYEIVAKPII